jgi:hypothetical protein
MQLVFAQSGKSTEMAAGRKDGTPLLNGGFNFGVKAG